MLKVLGAQIKEFKKDSLLTPVFMILEVVMEMIIPLLMASIIDEGVNAGNLNHIYKIGALMIGVALIGLWAGLMGAKYGAKASTGFARNLRKSMFENIQTYSFSNIDKYSTSSLITRLTTDVTNVQNAYQMVLRMAMRAPASMIIAMVMAFSINARLASIYLVAVIFLGICLSFIMPRANRYFRQLFEKYDDLNASVQENVSAIRVVKAYVREDYEKEKFSKANQNIYNMFLKAEKLVVINMPLMQVTVYGCILLISWFGAKTIVAGNLTTGEMMSLLAYCMNILMSLMMVSMIFVMLSMSYASAKRISEVLTEQTDLKNPENPVMNVKDGSIVFDHVSFRYPGSDKYALKDISIEFKVGEKLAVVGMNGSGKSTFIKLLCRLYDPTEGTIYMNGIDIRRYDYQEYFGLFSVVFQDFRLFSFGLGENVAMSETFREEAVRDALVKAGMEEFLKEHNDDLSTTLYRDFDKNGVEVSGGEAQKIALARAVCKGAPFVLLDEPTAALDPKAEYEIYKRFNDLVADRTTVYISHRMSSCRFCGDIAVFHEGRMVQRGSHESLLEETTGKYYELWTAQAQYYVTE